MGQSNELGQEGYKRKVRGTHRNWEQGSGNRNRDQVFCCRTEDENVIRSREIEREDYRDLYYFM